ncbi:MAG TPA: S41 family peptidase [Candidatus Omnitrophota bacterium]|nr:S41 family peptidase [Candidatus Omnitrophota bacterium]
MNAYKKVIVGFLLVASLFTVGFIVGRGQAEDSLEKKLEVYLQVLTLVKNQYVEKNLDDTKLVYGSVKGLLGALEDPYTRFMEPKAYKEMRIRLRGSYSGIGIYIGMKDDLLTVISPIPDTPADKAGLKARDRIVSIDDKPTKDMSLDEAVSIIRGPQGTNVKLGIIRGSAKEPAYYVIKRENINIKSTSFKMLNDKVAYIKLSTFEKQDAPEEFQKAIMSARDKNAEGLIVDLRGNGGGLLDNAIQIGSMFIREGVIVQTVDRDGMKDIKYSTGQVLWWKPVVVLIDGGSASASEILAGALKDDKIAPLVGSRSFGKASVQSVRVLQDDSCVLLTIAKYLTPSGADISKKGIQPDYVVDIPTKEAELEDYEKAGRDTQLEKAIQVVEEKMRGI